MNASKKQPARSGLRQLRVLVRPRSHHAVLLAGAVTVHCTIGRSGAIHRKREGDGATPFGTFPIFDWYVTPGPSRLRGSRSPRPITASTGWCDDPAHPAYNRPVRLPATASHESMLRTDGKYAIVGVMGYNITPRVRPLGSAIFFHINDEPGQGTAGCVALRRADMRRLLPRLGRHVVIRVE